VLFLLSYR